MKREDSESTSFSRGSNSTGNPIDWPALPGRPDEIPQWIGRGFRVGNEMLAVLPYAVEPTGWNDELADIVASEAAVDRPIHIASLSLAVSELKQALVDREFPVILEIGCFQGGILQTIRTSMPNAGIVGADHALPPLQKLAEEIPDIPLLRLDLVHSPLPDQSVDAIVALNVLEHIEDDRAAMRQIYRMLRPGGVAVIEVPAMPGLYDVFDEQVGHYRRYTMTNLVDALRTVGFSIERRSHLGFLVFPMFWLAKKRNRRHGKSDLDQRREIMIDMLRVSTRSKLLRIAFRAEELLRRYVTLPFGIRCVVTCRRPR